MRTLRRVACVALFCGLLGPLAFGQSRAEFDRLVDFSVTLKTVAAAAAGEASLPRDRLLLLEGSITEIVVLDKESATYTVRLELMAGEWIGVEEVRGYRCYVTFAGPGYAELLPSKALRSRVLVVARVLSPTTTPLGEKVMALEGLAVRVVR